MTLGEFITFTEVSIEGQKDGIIKEIKRAARETIMNQGHAIPGSLVFVDFRVTIPGLWKITVPEEGIHVAENFDEWNW